VNKWNQAYMNVAERFAELSTARRLKVGAIIVKDNRIISIGYNGMPSGWDNNCEDEIGHVLDDSGNIIETRTKKKDEVIHAEANAISKLASSNESGKDADIFITHAPCMNCAKLIYGSRIKQVYFKKIYRSEDGIKFLKACNIGVEQV
jgi:dCMP deaminase